MRSKSGFPNGLKTFESQLNFSFLNNISRVRFATALVMTTDLRKAKLLQPTFKGSVLVQNDGGGLTFFGGDPPPPSAPS